MNDYYTSSVMLNVESKINKTEDFYSHWFYSLVGDIINKYENKRTIINSYNHYEKNE